MRLTVLVFLIASLLAVLPCPASGGNTAELIFESFDGGGPEYSAEVFDKSIVSCKESIKHHNVDHDQVDGAGYSVIMTFTGLRQGKTAVRIVCTSSIADNWVNTYDITVDRNLNVVITERPEIERLYMVRSGYRVPKVFEIQYDGLDYNLEKEVGNETEYEFMSPEAMAKINDVIYNYDVRSWDGFDKYDKHALDGEDFTFSVKFSDGSKIYAKGSNKFPNNYRDVFRELESILEDEKSYL